MPGGRPERLVPRLETKSKLMPVRWLRQLITVQ